MKSHCAKQSPLLWRAQRAHLKVLECLLYIRRLHNFRVGSPLRCFAWWMMRIASLWSWIILLIDSWHLWLWLIRVLECRLKEFWVFCREIIRFGIFFSPISSDPATLNKTASVEKLTRQIWLCSVAAVVKTF